jgi:hypothetical protein
LINNTPGSNVVGGTDARARNVISGFYVGVEIYAPGATATVTPGSLVVGNYIGTDVTGEVGLGNETGVLIYAAGNNTIGGPTATPGTGLGNVIADSLVGIYLLGSTVTGNQIVGNLIGLDASGKKPLGNYIGVYLDSAIANGIGGGSATDRNVIAGNQQNGAEGSTGLYFFDNAKNNVALNNYIGTDINGNPGKGLGQGDYGVLLYNAPNNTVPLSGNGSNKILGSGIAPVREFTGSTSASPSSGSPAMVSAKVVRKDLPTGPSRVKPGGAGR